MAGPLPRVLYNVTAASDDAAAQVLAKRSIDPVVWGGKSWDFAKHWLADCHASHHACRNPALSAGHFVPGKLLKLNCDHDGNRVELYETTEGEELQWSALSYCWGGDQDVKATKETVEELKRGIALFRLPQTLQDAVSVSRSLEIPYLWVDALCIMQDDHDEMAHELQQVPLIYRHAYVTISASSAESVHEGFLQNRGYFHSNLKPFYLPYESADGARGNLLMSEDDIYTVNRDDWQEPVARRCWTLQEQMLSPRILQFEQRQLTFRCVVSHGDSANGVSIYPKFDRRASAPSTTSDVSSPVSQLSEFHLLESSQAASDAASDNPPSNQPESDEIASDGSSSNSAGHSPSSSSAGPSSPTPRFTLYLHEEWRQQSWSQWTTVVQNYSRRTLGFPEDKLRALSGLARMIAHDFRYTYIAGMFMQHLPLALCWMRQEMTEMRPFEDYLDAPDPAQLPDLPPLPHVGPPPLPAYNGAPSWSWLAADGEISYGGEFRDINKFDTRASILEVSVYPKTPFTTYDAIDGGVISLRGHLAAARWYPDNARMTVEEHEFFTFNDTGHADLAQGEAAYIDAWALLLATERGYPFGGPVMPADGEMCEANVFYSASPDGYMAGLVLEACGEGTYKRLAVFQEPPYKRTYSFEDIEPQVVHLI
ncbi:hypothetical protein BP5796_04461 [Coleophoma crateriformis]|uniref:Heterokaryon incompatibility domain-containing protein n=1 Tax=Coleophoma crateriformis TaxID=565419 RepID=A0A3D8S9N7_9HELO|nr:hypothetical protein BP5796_04461 [Coleophoma crateriformis]